MTKGSLIIILFFSLLTDMLAQKTLKDFDGDLLFKESYYYYPVTRQTYDTVVTYSNYELKKMIEIENSGVISKNESKEISYIPIKFFKNKDSVFYKYADPFDIDHDTTYVKLFPLNFNDSVETAFCFKITMDTIRGTDKKRTLTIHTECDGDHRDIKTFRTKDTMIYFKEFKFDCYTFEQKAPIPYYKDVYFTRKIIVDKQTLIPIDVKEYNFHTSRRPRFKNIHQGKNLLTYHQKIISIE
jgi:hypothetical protein